MIQSDQSPQAGRPDVILMNMVNNEPVSEVSSSSKARSKIKIIGKKNVSVSETREETEEIINYEAGRSLNLC